MLQIIKIFFIWYFLFGLVIIGIGLVTERFLVKDWPKFNRVLLFYIVWPLFVFKYIKHMDGSPQEKGSLFK